MKHQNDYLVNSNQEDIVALFQAASRNEAPMQKKALAPTRKEKKAAKEVARRAKGGDHDPSG